MLLTLTLITVALVVLALAGYLIAIAWALLDTRKSVAAIADGLEAVRDHTGALAGEADHHQRRAGRAARRPRGRRPPPRAGGPVFRLSETRGPHVL